MLWKLDWVVNEPLADAGVIKSKQIENTTIKAVNLFICKVLSVLRLRESLNESNHQFAEDERKCA